MIVSKEEEPCIQIDLGLGQGYVTSLSLNFLIFNLEQW